jgi:hypothetical protein
MTDRVHAVEFLLPGPMRDDDAAEWAQRVSDHPFALGPVMTGDDYLRGTRPTWKARAEKAEARIAKLEAVVEAAAAYISATGACDNASLDDWDPPSGLCNEPGCGYCDHARAVAALDAEEVDDG